jgi:hypothetical protein
MLGRTLEIGMLGPEHWIERARQARKVAGWVSSPEARRLLLEIAERYERIGEIPGALVLGHIQSQDNAQGS